MNTLQAGDRVPEFTTVDQDGQTVNNTTFEGKKWIVFFYPRANTPGCTAEACNLRDHYQELKDKGYTLVGASADSPRKQKNFQRKYDFPFPLLADEARAIIEAFGVWGSKKFMGRTFDGIHRTTFAIDETGTVTHVISKVKTKDHAAQMLEVI